MTGAHYPCDTDRRTTRPSVFASTVIRPGIVSQLAVVLCAMLLDQPVGHAQTPPVVATDWGRIESFNSTWAVDAMGVHHSAPFVNSQYLDVIASQPGHSVYRDCRTRNDGYATDDKDPNHKLNHAIIIGAFLHGKQVRLFLQNCSFDRPRIVGIEVRDN